HAPTSTADRGTAPSRSARGALGTTPNFPSAIGKPRERMPRGPSGSLKRLQVGPHDPLDATVARMAEQRFHIAPATLAPGPQCLEHDVHSDLVAELETIGERLFWAIDPDRHAVQLVDLDALAERRSREPVQMDRGILDARRLGALLEGHVDLVRNLSR